MARKPRQTNWDADDDHTRDKMDFDETLDLISPSHEVPGKSEDSSDDESENRSKEIRLYRQGKEYPHYESQQVGFSWL